MNSTKMNAHKLDPNSLKRAFLWITIFAMAMAYMESAVVVYLRALYFPEGFSFPMAPIPQQMAITEFFRELATMLMLLSAAYVAGRNAWTRFAWFMWCFGVWDIFYYVWLKVLIDWPGSFMEWDILFLVPIPWTGPVLAPIIVSLSLMLFALVILKVETVGSVELSRIALFLLCMGALIIIISMCLDHYRFAAENGLLSKLFSIPGKEEMLFGTIAEYVPRKFDWWLFIIGETLAGLVAFKLLNSLRNSNRAKKGS